MHLYFYFNCQRSILTTSWYYKQDVGGSSVNLNVSHPLLNTVFGADERLNPRTLQPHMLNVTVKIERTHFRGCSWLSHLIMRTPTH